MRALNEIPPETLKRDRFWREARKWVGVKYVDEGRGPDAVDCVGLVLVAAAGAGIVPEGHDGPLGKRGDDAIREEIERWAEPVLVWPNNIRPGDILLIKTLNGPRHVAVASRIDYGTESALGMIHAYNITGKVVEHILDDRWLRRIVGVWRLS